MVMVQYRQMVTAAFKRFLAKGMSTMTNTVAFNQTHRYFSKELRKVFAHYELYYR